LAPSGNASVNISFFGEDCNVSAEYFPEQRKRYSTIILMKHAPARLTKTCFFGKIRAREMVVIKKLRLYLDTSVISYLDQQDTLERMADTLKLWERIKAGEFEVMLSSVTETEIDACSETKKSVLKKYLEEIEYSVIKINDSILDLAERFIDFGVLREKSLDDCRHIAAAIISNCDVIVSWNFKHIVNHKTIVGVKAVTTLEGYKELLIYAPPTLTGGI
jgi:predicted nucleic acid-binding protein